MPPTTTFPTILTCKTYHQLSKITLNSLIIDFFNAIAKEHSYFLINSQEDKYNYYYRFAGDKPEENCIELWIPTENTTYITFNWKFSNTILAQDKDGHFKEVTHTTTGGMWFEIPNNNPDLLLINAEAQNDGRPQHAFDNTQLTLFFEKLTDFIEFDIIDKNDTYTTAQETLIKLKNNF